MFCSDGQGGKKRESPLSKGATFATDLNHFYSRFDNPAYLNRNDNADFDIFTHTTDHSIIILSEAEVAASLARIDPNKAPGPDVLEGRVIKSCRLQLTAVFTKLFQLLLNEHSFPKIWKLSSIIPVPKRPRPAEPNDFRPVALTSILGKCMERVEGINHLSTSLNEWLIKTAEVLETQH